MYQLINKLIIEIKVGFLQLLKIAVIPRYEGTVEQR